MTTLGELFLGRDLIELMGEMEDVLGFLELFEENKDAIESITLTIQTKHPDGETKTAEISIPPEMERFVRKIVKKKVRLIKKRGRLLSWLLT